MMRRSLFAACATMFAAAAPALAQSPGQIETQQLAELTPWTVSALSRANGAFPADLWRNTDPAFLVLVLDRLPAVYESPAAQELARRVLLSGGEAPAGDAAAAARKRFEVLGKMGAADEVAIMAAGIASSLADPAIAQYAAQAELARGRRAEACARGRSAQAGEAPSAFILRLRAYCAATGGDRAAADLALDIARQANAADAWYTSAVAAAGGAAGARPPAARYDSSLAAALSLAGNLRPAANALASASTLSLLALARADAAPQPQRVQAAALAFRRGALSPAETRTILRATPGEIATALPPIVVALRQVDSAPGSLEAARAIAGVLRQAAAPADFAAAARFFKDDIAAMQTAPDHTSALLFARAAVATGDVALAERLMTSLRQAGLPANALAPIEASLAALAGVTTDAARLAIQRRIDAGGASLARAAARDVAILAALGAPMDDSVRAFLAANAPQGGTPADPQHVASLTLAVERRASAEAALLAVLAASPAGPARLDIASLERIITALRTVGLEQDARRFAAEALLAGQPR